MTSDFIFPLFMLVLLMYLNRDVHPRYSRFRSCCQPNPKDKKKITHQPVMPLTVLSRQWRPLNTNSGPYKRYARIGSSL